MRHSSNQVYKQADRVRDLASAGHGDVWLVTGKRRTTLTLIEAANKRASEKGRTVITVTCDASESLPTSIVRQVQAHCPNLREETALLLSRLRLHGNPTMRAMPDVMMRRGTSAIEAVRQLLQAVSQREQAILWLRGVPGDDDATWAVLKALLEQPFHNLSSLRRPSHFRMPAVWITVDRSTTSPLASSRHLAEVAGLRTIEADLTTADNVRAVLNDPAVIENLTAFCGGDTALLRNWLKSAPQDGKTWYRKRVGNLSLEARVVLRLLQMDARMPRLSTLTITTGLPALSVRRAIQELRDLELFSSSTKLLLMSGVRTLDLGHIINDDEKRLILHAAEHLATAWELDRDQTDLECAVKLLLLAGARAEAQSLAKDLVDLWLIAERPRHGLELLPLVLEGEPVAQVDADWHLRRVELLQQAGDTEAARASAEQHLLNRRQPDGHSTLRLGRILRAFGWFHPLIHIEIPQLCSQVEKEQIEELKSEAYQAVGEPEKALEILENLPPSPTRAVAVGNILFLQGEMERAESLYRSALSDLDAVSKMRALHNLGLISMRGGNHKQAEKELRLALDSSEASEEHFGSALCKVNLAFVLEQQERFRPAKEFLLEAIELFNRHNRTRNLCGAMTALGDLYRRFGAYSDSKRVLNEAIHMASQADLVRERADAQMRLGAVELERGRAGVATDYLIPASRALRELGHPEEASKALILLAECAIERKEMGERNAWMGECEDLQHVLSDERLSEMFWLKGTSVLLEDPRQALGHAEQALSLARRAGQREPELRALQLLVDGLLAVGRRTDAQTATEDGFTLFAELERRIPDNYKERFRSRPAFSRWTEAPEELMEELPADPVTRESSAAGLSRPEGFKSILGDSPQLVRMLAEAHKLAATGADLMLRGESGTGKEILAAEIVARSARSQKPFVRVNAAALTDQLLQSELFGHVKGSFTGAHKTTRGKLEEAHTGTLFLDEVGELSQKAQVVLLRALQERAFQKVGSSKEIKVDVRFLFATNANLEARVREGVFRKDLFHRMCGLQITLPPLRERNGDIRTLATAFLEECNVENQTKACFTGGALRRLENLGWPGNVRELRHRVRRAFLLREGNEISKDLFPGVTEGLVLNRTDTCAGPAPVGKTLDATLLGVEKHLIAETLEKTGGNISHAARILGVSRPRLSQKVKEYGLKKGVSDES